MNLIKTHIVLLIAIVTPFVGVAQENNLDKILAIVGDKIILKSEIDMAYLDYKRENPDMDESAKCNIIEQYLGQKILVEQAARDSVMVSDEEVEGALENRIRYFISLYGSVEKLEEMSGKPIYQLKDDYRSLFRDQMIAQRMQGQIMSGVKITPQEVRQFYQKIPADSLPFYPSALELGSIVMKPDVNKEVEQYAYTKLEDIRKEIVSGKAAFDVMAGIYSEDPGSKDNGGDLGVMGRDELVPEFAAAAFKLQNGEISPVVKTKFGYHIIQMQNRQGEKAKMRHILIKPIITKDMVSEEMKRADSVRSALVSGKMKFSEAVAKYNEDEMTKNTGGMMVNQQTGSTMLMNEDLDPTLALMMNDMKEGEFSQPMEYNDPQTGDLLVRIVYLKRRVEPHKANLDDDYSKIQEVALAEKQNEYLNKWITTKIPTFYIKVDKDYADCKNIATWIAASENAKK